MSNPRSLPIWLRPTGGQWTRYSSATEATDYLTTAHGLQIYRTQVTRAAEKRKTRDGWEFTDKDPREAPPPVPEDAPAQLRPTALTSYFSTISAPCACCDEKLHGAIVRCTLCQKDAYEICTQHGKCLRCVCRVCDSPSAGVMRTCKQCKRRVHQRCSTAVMLEAVCHVCSAPRPALPPSQPKVRKFKPKWREGRPWLCHENGLMWCAACREYPQQGVCQSWVDGNSCLRLSTVKDHTKCGLHAKSLALRNSAGASSSVVGALPSPVQSCIRGLFAVVYRIAKRDGALNDLPGDAELVTLTGGSITPSYHGRTASVTILHAIAAPYRADEGVAIMASQFFGLASDSCTDMGAHKEELLYTRTVRNGVVTTSYLGCEYLKSGDAGAIVASYKRALLRAGAPVEEWVARLFWYWFLTVSSVCLQTCVKIRINLQTWTEWTFNQRTVKTIVRSQL